MTSASSGNNLGDVYDFLSGYASLIATCSDAVDYLVNYALTTAYDPATGTQGAPCPTSKSAVASPTCSASCNAAWNILNYNCAAGQLVQYDYNGLPGGVVAPPNTFLPIEVVVNLILNGSAFGPNNADYAGGTDLALVVSDPTCVASSWLGQNQPDGSTTVNMNAPVAQQVPVNVNGPAPVGMPPAPLGAGMAAPTPMATLTCQQAAAAMNTSTSTGNCAQCLSDTGSPLGCMANCPACASDWNALQAACGLAGDSTLQLTYNLAANVWADNLLQVGNNFTMGDCYLHAMVFAEPLAASCSDYFDYMTSYSQTNFFVNPQNASLMGPACPTVAADTAAAPGSCPAACAADLANLAGCTAASTVVVGSASYNFATAWQMFVNGTFAAIDPFYNTFTTNTGSAAYNLSGCASVLSPYTPGVLANGTVNTAVLPAAAPNCTTARATLAASTLNGACDLCSSNTGNPNNCFTSVSGDPDCTLCGVQFDAYTAVCNETYNDLGNTFAANLASTTAGGAGGDCYDMFNQLAQSLLGPATGSATPAGVSADPCSDVWDSMLQYSETVLNDPPFGATAGPNCPTQPGALCSAACQNDLSQLFSVCSNTSVVQWAGMGTPSNMTGAPAGTNVSFLNAWAYFANGTATAPIGNVIVKGKAVSVPFALGNCTLPNWLPASATNFTPVYVKASFSITLPQGTTLASLYAKNQAAGGALEATIAASIGVDPETVTILWAAMGVNIAGTRRLLASSTIQYQVATTPAGAAAVNSNLATFNPSTALSTTFSSTLGVSGVTVSASTPTSGAVAPAGRVAVALLAAAAAAIAF